ncbi:Hsp20/alpha crystallin family protein [Cupriavidus pinatubonensis]|uniref:Hsp20/alpha crystallin family protein n=1 Tax=Cupriavidus pinatubonensis TaxID=248026 RepID=UPI001FD342BB|nr:Hsp20/alpha crystallin family protein [Cupriavidus pinatubonensis]
MPDKRFNPMWEPALVALERAGHLHLQFFRLAGQSRQVPVWEPPVELVEQGGRLIVIVALPGVSPDAVDLTLEGDVLSIRAQRHLPRAFSGGTVHCLEIPYGRFERRLALPPGPYQLRQRSSEDGCLLLVLERLD